MSQLNIALPQTFNLEASLAYLNRSPHELLHRVEGPVVWKLLSGGPNAEPLLLQLDFSCQGLLQLDVLNRSLKKGEAAEVQNYINQWWDLERDLSPFYALAKKDELLQKTLASSQGLRLMGVPDLFEAICWSIIGQQINLAFAYQLKKRLVENYGQSYVWKGQKYWLFPEPETLAHTSVESLFSLKITARKCEYLIGLAQAIIKGELNKEKLLSVSSVHKASELLIAHRGIGPWSAHYVLMRCLRYTDAFPVGDAGLQNAVKRLLGMDRKPTEAELHALAEKWSGWEAYATFYLWSAG